MAANTPMLLRAGLVEGNTHAGVLASGQVVGILDDLPSCAELIDSIVSDAIKPQAAAALVVNRPGFNRPLPGEVSTFRVWPDSARVRREGRSGSSAGTNRRR